MNYNFFKISDLFDVHTGGDKPKENDYTGIKVNSIENLTTNNGIKEKIYYNGKNIFSNFISVVSIGKGGKSFYQESPSAIFTRVKALIPKDFELNIYTAMYLITILDMEQFKYSYGRVVSTKKLKDTLIKLPVNIQNEPDWFFIEDFIKKLDVNKILNLQISNKKSNITLPNFNEWNYFSISSIFKLKKGESLNKIDCIEGLTPYIGASEVNNSVTGILDIAPNRIKNTFTINRSGSVGYCAFHDYDYFASENVFSLFPKFLCNRFIGIFIKRIINENRFKYSYGRTLNTNRILNIKIKLPVDEKGEPDWNLITDYVKSLPYSEYI